MASPLHYRTRSSSGISKNMRTAQNPKAAAQRLARVMAHQSADDEEEEDDLLDEPSASIGLAGGRQTRSSSPLSVRNSVELPPSVRPASGPRASATVNLGDSQPLSARLLRPVKPKPVEPCRSIRSSMAGRSYQSINSADEEQPPSSRSYTAGRSPSYTSSIEQPSSARYASLGRPNLRVKTVPTVPPSVPLSVKLLPSGSADRQTDKNRDKRLSLDFGTFKNKEASGQQSSSALQDELDMLQEENDSLLEKLRVAEERYEEAELRTRQLEKQIASLGEGVSLEARLLSRKEADLQKREVALKAAAETHGGTSDEIAVLKAEVETARDEATSALDQLQEVDKEVKSLGTVAKRMILTQEEMEEIVLKRCWLARSWGLCVRHGIHAEIAGSRHEYWSSFASRPVEVILAVGRKAKANSSINNDLEEREKVLKDNSDISKMANLESMLLVEKGLKELSLLKVEEALAISMAQKRRPSVLKSNDELKLPTEGNIFSEPFELSQEESEDVLLKQAWLMYFWRRAKNQGLEPDIAEERLQFWINQGGKPPTSQDAVDVERGLLELQKLGIETKLWEESRRLIDPDNTQKTMWETELQILS